MIRVVSLLPSATEIVCGLGLGDALVGVSHECDWPRDVVGAPIMTSSKLDPHRASADIDRDVRELLRDALAIYAIELDALGAAAPDVIVTQDLCDVCAVSYDDVCRAVNDVLGNDVVVVNLRPTRLDDIWQDITRVAQALDVQDAGRALIEQLRGRIDAVASRVAGLERPTVLTIEWLDPVMIGGLWMPELVESAGGVPLVTKAGQPAPTVDADALDRLDPDVVLIKPCGFKLDQIWRERALVDQLIARHDWPPQRVFVADGNAYFNRPGPRIVDSLELLAGCLHPRECEDLRQKYAREAKSWQSSSRSL